MGSCIVQILSFSLGFLRPLDRSSPFVEFTKLPDRFVFARNKHLRQRKISVLKPRRLHIPAELFGNFDLVLPEHLKLRLFEFQPLPFFRRCSRS